MPGLRLKAFQIQRLFGVDPEICQAVLDSLVRAKFLYLASDGRYTLMEDEPVAGNSRHKIN